MWNCSITGEAEPLTFDKLKILREMFENYKPELPSSYPLHPREAEMLMDLGVEGIEVIFKQDTDEGFT